MAIKRARKNDVAAWQHRVVVFRTRVRALEDQLENLTWYSNPKDVRTLEQLEEALKPVEEIIEKWDADW